MLVNGFGKFTQPSFESGGLDSLIILNEGIGPVRSLFPDHFREKTSARKIYQYSKDYKCAFVAKQGF